MKSIWYDMLLNKFDFILKEKFISCFFAMMPLFMYLGRALFYIHILVVFVLFTLSRFRKSFTGQVFTPFFTFTVCYFILTVFINLIPTEYSYLNNIQKNVSIAFMVMFVSYTCQYLFINSEKSSENRFISLRSTFFSISIVSAVIVVGYVFGINVVYSIKYFELREFAGWQYHSSQSFISITTCFLMFFYYKNKSKSNLFLLLLFFLATLVSHGRTAIVATVVSASIYSFLSTSGRRGFWVYFSIALILFSSLLSVSYLSSGDPFAFADIHTSRRFEGSIKYIQYILTHSPYWGLGIDGGKYLLDQGVIPYGSPHNVFLDSFVTMGWAGLIVFSSFLLFLLLKIKNIYINADDPHQRALLLSTLVAILLAGQMYLSIWSKHNMVLIFFYLYLAISIVTPKNVKSDIVHK